MILQYVPTKRFLDPAEGIDWKLATEPYYELNAARSAVELMNFSDIAAPLADYHLDIGKTLGIKRLRVELIYKRTAGAYYNATSYSFYDPEHPDADIAGWVYQLGDFGWGFGPTPETHPALFPLEADPPVNDYSLIREFGPDEFLLINLNFKTHRAGRVSVDEVEPTWLSYTFANAVTREVSGPYEAGDIGKFAYETETDTFWTLIGTAPRWQITESPERRAELIAATQFNRPVCFFGVTAEDYDGVHTEGAFALHGWYMSPDKDVWDNSTSPHPRPPHPDPKDERVFKSDFGLAWVETSPPAAAAYGHNAYKNVFRWRVAIKVLTQPDLADGVVLEEGAFPLHLGRWLTDDDDPDDNIFDPWVIDLDFHYGKAKWLKGHIDAPPNSDIDDGMLYTGVWQADKTYAQNEIVLLGDEYYRSIAIANTNHNPADGAPWWQLTRTRAVESHYAETRQENEIGVSWTLDENDEVEYPSNPDPGADPPGSDVFSHIFAEFKYDLRQFTGRFSFLTTEEN